MGKESEKTKGFLTGVLMGGVIGSALAMLYTPFTGKKLRKKILKKTDDVIDTGKEKAGAIKDKTNDLVKEGKKKAEGFMGDAKKIVSN